MSRRKGPFARTQLLGKLSDSEWGWIVSTVVWGWVATRSEQAAIEGLDTERAIRTTKLDPDPWDVGAIRAILPELAKSCAGFDWSRPANTWSKDELAEFLASAFALIQRATSARDAIEEQVAGKAISADVIAQTDQRLGRQPNDDGRRVQRRRGLLREPPVTRSLSRANINLADEPLSVAINARIERTADD